MPRYAALLRGVSPMNCKMPELKRALERAGFTDVKTVISSGNAVFSSQKPTAKSQEPIANSSLEKKCEAAFEKHLGKAFLTIVRPVDYLAELLETDPYIRYRLPAGAKRNVTFLRTAPEQRVRLPVDLRGAQIVALKGREAFSYYVPNRVDPAFMVLLERTFGKAITTRTWETVERIVKAAEAI